MLGGCGLASDGVSATASLEQLLTDGALESVMSSAVAAAPEEPPAEPAPPRFCPAGDCDGIPLAFWTFDDCNPQTTELGDSSSSSQSLHAAYRAVSVACVAGRTGMGVELSGGDDIVYAPDQPDFLFDRGVTVAAWINPVDVSHTQSIVRKRLDGSSSFFLGIDHGRLEWVVRLKGGQLVEVSAPVPAGRFTHVTGTYDGSRLSLYLDGVLQAQSSADGTIAAGAGPLFVGNDANGRAFHGLVDDLWLNDIATSAGAIAGLACQRQPPSVSLSPSSSDPAPAGTAHVFDLAVTNANEAACPIDDFFAYAISVPAELGVDPVFASVSAASGETAHVSISVAASDLADPGTFPFQYLVWSAANFQLQATVEATLVATAAEPVVQTGCAGAPAGPVAAAGYYVNGNTVCTAAGRPHLFHGVDRPSLEWLSTGDGLSLADFELMRGWNANVVRIALNQDFWLQGSSLYDPEYARRVADAVGWAEAAGLDVILDLHWSDAGVLGSCAPEAGCQQKMPDQNSLAFWSQLAAHFGGDGRVLFELYNEPHDVPWEVWQSGGDTGDGWQAVGMQQLYDAVRATGAENLVVIGGLNWAYDLSGVPSHRIQGHDIVYATHPYSNPASPGRPPGDWSRAWGSLAHTDPVVVTEFGSLADPTCATDYGAQVMHYADTHFAGWTAWAWFPGGCEFPALIEDWDGTPSPSGALVKAALLGYDDPPAASSP
jgi:endoglucanase